METTPTKRSLSIGIVDYGIAQRIEPTKWDDSDPPEPIEWSDPFDARRIMFTCGNMEAWVETPVELVQDKATLVAECMPYAEAFCQSLLGLLMEEVEKL